jgi:hypothetical protein
MKFSADHSYDDLPDLSPTVDIESKTVLKACMKILVVLTALRHGSALIPNPAFINFNPSGLSSKNASA